MGLRTIGAVQDTAEVLLFDPFTDKPVMNADGSQMSVTVYGPYSDHYKRISHQQQNRRLAKMQRTGGKMVVTAEELDSSSLDILVKCVAGWNVTLGDKPEPFSEDAVRSAFLEFPWMREQVDAGFGDTRAFLTSSATP